MSQERHNYCIQRQRIPILDAYVTEQYIHHLLRKLPIIITLFEICLEVKEEPLADPMPSVVSIAYVRLRHRAVASAVQGGPL